MSTIASIAPRFESPSSQSVSLMRKLEFLPHTLFYFSFQETGYPILVLMQKADQDRALGI